MKHTQGQWDVGYRFRSDGTKEPDRIISESGLTICEGFAWNQNAVADSNLIAAAPELLEALELFIEEQCEQRPHEHSNALGVARAILAKAKGETP